MLQMWYILLVKYIRLLFFENISHLNRIIFSKKQSCLLLLLSVIENIQLHIYIGQLYELYFRMHILHVLSFHKMVYVVPEI